MENDATRRKGAFLVAAAISLIVTIALFRLPETFVEKLHRNRPFDISTSGWIYRLMSIAAIAQAAYVGFVLLRVERVKRARETDPKLSHLSKTEVMDSVARNAAVMALLTLVYGLSAFALTGQRAGYWLFFVLCCAQLAWYYRQVGEVQGWIIFQPEFAATTAAEGLASVSSEGGGHDYVPPLARGAQGEPPER